MHTSAHGLRKLRDRDESSQSVYLTEERLGPAGLIFCLLLIAAVTAVLDYDVLPPQAYRTRSPMDIPARLDFQYNDPNEQKAQREEAAQRAPRVYNEDPEWVSTVLSDLTELAAIAEVASNAADAQLRAARFPLDAQLVEALYKFYDANERKRYLSTLWLDRVRLSLKILAENGILSPEDLQFERNKPGELREIIRLSRRGSEVKEERVPVSRLTDVNNAAYDLERASWRENLPPDLERLVARHLRVRLAKNLTLDPALTLARKERARESAGIGDVQVRKRDILIAKDQPVGRAELDKLREEWRACKRALPLEARVRHLAGLAALCAALLLMFLVVMNRMDEHIFQRRRALIMLGLLVLAAVAGTRALLLAGYSAALVPLIFVGMAASLAFNQTVALLTLLGLAVLTAFAGTRWEAFPSESTVPALGLALMAGGLVAALPAGRLRDRWDLLKYAVAGGIVQFILAAGLSQIGDARPGVPTLTDAVLALINGPLCGLLVLGSLPVVEALFGILTNIRLFELADMNQPLLRRIQDEAPGTFAHTLQVRSLAEPAADAIGANTRLVSTGVLYHDLGKTLKPEYFVENQMEAEERHRRLRPSVSALLITAHVKDGMELAREYGLPEQIIAFIPEHHGTTLVSYFYHSAKKDAESSEKTGGAAAADSVQEAFFRYPGPKPQSRETAIVMIADTVEAACRTLRDPSAARLRAFVHELVMDKMLDGQLDECDLTFAELALLEESFVRVLVTRYHSRVRYPGQEENEPQDRAPGNKTTIMHLPAPDSSAQSTDPSPSPSPSPSPVREKEVS